LPEECPEEWLQGQTQGTQAIGGLRENSLAVRSGNISQVRSGHRQLISHGDIAHIRDFTLRPSGNARGCICHPLCKIASKGCPSQRATVIGGSGQLNYRH